MLCHLCGKHEARVDFEGLIQGKVVKFYLCDECLKSIDIESALTRTHFSPEDFLSALSASMEAGGSDARRLKQVLRKANAASKEASLRVAEATIKEQRLRELEQLRDDLKKAVTLEEYERAAVLRDQIAAMEKEPAAEIKNPFAKPDKNV